MKEVLLGVAVMAVFALASYYAMTIPFLYIYLPVAGYAQIRRLGYSPTKAALLVLGVTVLGVLSTVITAVLVPKSNGFWGILGIFVLCIAMPILLSAFGCTLLVRKLPKRESRVSGPRPVRFPFIYLGYLIIAGGVVGCVAVLVVAPSESRTIDNIFGLLKIVSMTAVFGAGLIIVGKRVGKQVSIEEAVSSDTRSPVLFLRPFVAEHVPFVQGPNSKYGRYSTTNQQLLTSLRSSSDSEGNKLDEDPTISIMFEVYLGGEFRKRIGPFIALGNPEDYLPPEGAIRTYADDEGWYEYFERLAQQAICMVMPVSNSGNLHRELAYLRCEGLQQRLFIFTPLCRPGDVQPVFPARAASWIVLRLYGIGNSAASVASWSQIAGNLAKLGFDLGVDPGRGAVVTFDSEGKAMVLVTAAETPPEFVEPLREHLMRTFGLDLGDVAATKCKTGKSVGSENGAREPIRGVLITGGQSDECTDPSTPTQTEASGPTPATERPLMRFLNSKYGTWVGVALIPICICAYISFHMWRLNKADSLYDQKRYVEAAHYFQKEAESGNTHSMATLGYMYEEGLGVSKSEEQAAALYLKAVNDEDRPNSQAMVNLAAMYLDGRGGLARDEVKALELCRRAADADNENGMLLLAYLYEEGRAGLPKDPAAALDWYKKSAVRGNGFAATRVKELQQQR